MTQWTAEWNLNRADDADSASMSKFYKATLPPCLLVLPFQTTACPRMQNMLVLEGGASLSFMACLWCAHSEASKHTVAAETVEQNGRWASRWASSPSYHFSRIFRV